MGSRNSKRKSNSCSRPWISRALNRPIKSYKESGSDTEHSNRTHTEECRTWKQVLRFSFYKRRVTNLNRITRLFFLQDYQ